MLALATGILLVASVTVAAFPEVVTIGSRTAPVAQATVPSAAAHAAADSGADVVPRAAQVEDDPPPSETSTVHATASAHGATASGKEAEPEPAGPAPADRVPMSVGGAEGEVIRLTNQERREHGCGGLEPDARLARAARAHASDMQE
ncbi:MAG: CAP domain-containing protein, partial [Actinomycetes bacterium]